MTENVKFAWRPVMTWRVEGGILKKDGYIFWEKYDLIKTIYSGKRAFRMNNER